VSARGFYQYDRFFPTILLTAENTTDAFDTGRLLTRRATLNATIPVWRRLRKVHSLSLGYRYEERDAIDDVKALPFRYGGMELAWGFSNAEQFALSVTPVNGWRSRTAWLVERPGLGSDLRLSKLTTDIRGYQRVFGARDALALRAAAGATFGEPRFKNSFALGGYPDAGGFDIGRANFGLLRGYENDAIRGRKFVSLSAEYRFPLGVPQRGFFSAPAFLRRFHGSVFCDSGNVWTQSFERSDTRTAVGGGLGVDGVLGHGLPLTGTVTVGRGLSAGGVTEVYFRMGIAF
jgi:outer membrane translocation and assembly module TamA